MSADELNSLLARCALRDEKALAALYAKASSRLYALALGIVKQREWAEEVLQDAFMKVWSHADRFSPDKSSALTWMSTIVRNRAVDKLREFRRNPLLQEKTLADIDEIPLSDQGPDPADLALMSRDLKSLWNCLGTLEEEQKQVILMSYYHGYSHQELAQKLTAPLGTVKGWIRRGLEKLRMCLEI
ncbi:MAG TPA: sigma-70 family RNA polymerase sigma factor [Gammaproteobacteria bacterium]